MMRRLHRPLSLSCLAAILLLAACANNQASAPSGHPVYKVGEPYQVSGVWYYPHEDYSYDETGIASWYGADFHGGTTSNGEIFNKNELTAAHKTLPLPTLARITNLENGRSIVVRINDRGPFSGARIIDVSQRAAQLLGFEQKGTAEVRVTVLADESKAIADAMRHYGTGAAPVTVAANATPEQVASAAPPPVQSAAVEPVTSQELAPPPSPEVKTLEPVRTTPAVHQQLLETKPVQQVVQLPVGPHHIYVQAGAFTVYENATKLKQHLASLGSVTVVDAVVNGKKFYRVRVGPMPDVTSADRMIKRVLAAGASSARTVVE